MDRVIDTDDPLLDLMASVIAILTVPAPSEPDALAVPIGQGEEWRLRHAIELWEASPRTRHLLIANGNPAERTYVGLTRDYLGTLGLRRFEGVRVQPEPAPNTGLQAAWIAAESSRLGLRDLGLVVSAYHLPRVYLTVLKALTLRIPLHPVPVPVPPHEKIPETGATSYDLVPGEMTRILEYARKGWLATPAELREYLMAR
ncbi:ElyC/SanA/YdcF family protein [Actinoplanes sp. NPDC048796]|uniref:ElyC/SanA/YdcF family protein n=1 Tax=unclassified Actinoplanes TaxID=2626549 RepID=UPI0033EEEEA3